MNTTTTTNLTRANKLTVKVLTDGTMQADFYRTHKHLLTVAQPDTAYTVDPKANKTLTREMFRQYMADHATEYGINYDPTNRQTADNIRIAKYLTDEQVLTDAAEMVQPDIKTFYGKCPWRDRISHIETVMESLTAKTTTAKGTDLTTMGIEGGKYLSNGNWAWADIEGTITMVLLDGKTEIYVPIKLELVSGQLKKFRMTQTQFNDAVKADLLEVGILTEEDVAPKTKAKAEKSAKAETPAADTAGTKYEVEYIVKAGLKRGEEECRKMVVAAKNAKEACALCKSLVKKNDGINAFRPTAKQVEG